MFPTKCTERLQAEFKAGFAYRKRVKNLKAIKQCKTD